MMISFNGFRGEDVSKEILFSDSPYHKLILPKPFPSEKMIINKNKMEETIMYLIYVFNRINDEKIKIRAYDRHGDLKKEEGLAVFDKTNDTFEIHVV